MQTEYIIFLSLAVIIIYVTMRRKRLREEAQSLDDRLMNLNGLEIPSSFEKAKANASVENEKHFDDLEAILEYQFNGHIISATDEKNFTHRYSAVFKEVYELNKKLVSFHIDPSLRIKKLIRDYGAIHKIVQGHNEKVINERLEAYCDFFDHCLAYPLDLQQRRSIVSEEDNCLVVSSAGSGKTSSIVGKVKYLTEIKHVAPERILLISYTHKAATELTERMNVPGLRGYTFHKLALDLIGQVTKEKPMVCDNTDALFVRLYHDLLRDSKYRQSILEYFVEYQLQETDWEKKKDKRRQELSELKDVRLKAMLPDMDGNTIYVRSEQEQRLCFALSSLGVKFRYEEPYEYPVADEMHSQYKPDFSIHYERDGQPCRIYLEHFGIDEHGLVPAWFAKDRGITYEEANKRYGDGITWKRAVHEKFGTKLIETRSADFHYLDIKEKLKDLLRHEGVPFSEKSNEDLYGAILPEGSKQEKAFIRLVVTFVTLLKSSCKTLVEVLSNANDERSQFIIRNIFKPVCERYDASLRELGQIDFTDAILQATALCRSNHPVTYDYIIVDEFQDISYDRYQFLLALRQGNPPAKLYCVGDDWQSIYRFSGSDMALFNQFSEFFGPTEVNKIETTYRFGEPLVSHSSRFIQRNLSQIQKDIHPFNTENRTELLFQAYERSQYCDTLAHLISSIPSDKSIFLLGRYSFDDYYLSFKYQSVKEGDKFYYIICNRKIEFLTVHKSKGLEADYVILLMCNKDTYGFPSQINDDPVLDYVLTKSDRYPYGEERRLFYVAITRAKDKTYVMYDQRFPSLFVEEFLHPERITVESYDKHPNANKKWTRGNDRFLLMLHREGRSIKYIADKMGRSQTSIVMRLGKLGVG